MTTLTGEDLFKYLNHLEQEVTKRQSLQTENSFTHTVHGFMVNLIQAEQSYLEHVNPNRDNVMLSFSNNGLPSIESFNADLETMCKLTEEDSVFNISKIKVEPNQQLLKIDKKLHKLVSEKSWENTLSTYNTDDITRKKSFSIEETDDGKFKLSFNEEVYLNGMDEFCREHPIMIRSGKMEYNLIWQQLFEKCEPKFYVPNTSIVASGNLPILATEKEISDDINIKYRLKRSDYAKTKSLGKFGTKKRLPKSYNQLISAGYNTRLNVTSNILRILSETIGNEIKLGEQENRYSDTNIINDQLEDILNLSKHFEERTTLPTVSEYSSYDFRTYRLCIKKGYGVKDIGHIKYILPHRWFGKRLGRMILHVKGTSFTSSDSYLQACRELKKNEVFK